MMIKQAMLAGALGLWATASLAHSPLTSTTPSDAAILGTAPTNVSMTFKGKIRLTRVTLRIGEGDAAQLDLSGHTGFISSYTIPMSAEDSGNYLIEWRGLGADGHTMTGTFGFVVE